MGLWKTLRRRIEGIGVHRRVQVRRRIEFHGNRKGGWTLCPDGLGPESRVYSVGIGTNISFDRSLIEQYGLEIHAFDPTPDALAYLASRPLPERFHFHPWGLADHDGLARFHPHPDPREPSHSLLQARGSAEDAVEAQVRRLSTTMTELGHSHLHLLKLDIEGAEYGVLADLLRTGIPVDQILVEFHHRFHGVGREATNRAIHGLNAAGYRIAHVSDSGREYVFLHREL